WVDTGGDCLQLRVEPGLVGDNYYCLDHGEPITLLAGQVDQDGFSWREAEHEGQVGWVAEFYVTTDPDQVQVLYEAGTESAGIPVPPEGGLTMGLAGTTIPAAVA